MKRSIKGIAASVLIIMILWNASAYGAGEDTQILSRGGRFGNLEKDGIEVSKTISETGTENCFDITVAVKAKAEAFELSTADAAYTEALGDYIEFVGFLEKDGTEKFVLAEDSLNGCGAENAAETLTQDGKTIINWDLKKSAYQVKRYDEGSKQMEIYIYTLKYRIRLKNETEGFAGSGDYRVGDTAALTYRRDESIQAIEYPQPIVNGFFGQLAFKLTDSITGRELAGAELNLRHSDGCAQCRVSGCSVAIRDMTAVSDENGNVIFEKIPSGHGYSLMEAKAPDEYHILEERYDVNVFYGRTDIIGDWEHFSDTLDGVKITNDPILPQEAVLLPKTGGVSGLGLAMGMIFMAIAMAAQGERRSGGKRAKADLQKRTIKK